MGVEVLCHLISNDISEFVSLRLLFSDFELIKQLVAHLYDPTLLNEDIIGVLNLRKILSIGLNLLKFPRLMAIVHQSLEKLIDHYLMPGAVEFADSRDDS